MILEGNPCVKTISFWKFTTDSLVKYIATKLFYKKYGTIHYLEIHQNIKTHLPIGLKFLFTVLNNMTHKKFYNYLLQTKMSD